MTRRRAIAIRRGANPGSENCPDVVELASLTLFVMGLPEVPSILQTVNAGTLALGAKCTADPFCLFVLNTLLGIDHSGNKFSPQSGITNSGGSKPLNIPYLEQGNSQWGLLHIIQRHWYNATTTNASHFDPSIDQSELNTLVNMASGPLNLWVQQGSKLVRNIDIGKVIGTDPNGIATTWLRVVTDLSGKVMTAYPISNP